MKTIAHIINPVVVNSSSDLYIAQPVTFESMRVAKETARNFVEVKLYSAQFEEDASLVPDFILKTPDLNKSILDYGKFENKKKLPLLHEILEKLYQNTDAEYLIYTNVDIALLPNFYREIDGFIQRGYDSFVINRRTISSKYENPKQLPEMYKDPGKKHPGYDCFIFKRKIYPKLILENIVVGSNWVGWSFLTNLICFSRKMKIFDNLHLTFHIGEERIWKSAKFDDYSQFNYRQYKIISEKLESEIGKLAKYIKHFKVLGLIKFIKTLKYL